MTEKENSGKSPVALREEATLEFWEKNQTFKKSLEKPASKGAYVFYDGPPFATGLPHYGHILASAIKDAVPRYWTMKGYRVERKWGWDCHGLPIENIVEKDLKISGKRQIEEYGVDKFNEYARGKVLGFVKEWRETVGRIGRWVDFDGSYKTMDNSYIESVWWALKETSDKGLLYEGTRVLPYCPRCETPIANSEIAMDNSYKDISDISVYAKFELEREPGTYLVAWTTTPWTLPANTALAVNADALYVRIEGTEKNAEKPGVYIVAKELAAKIEALLPDAKRAGEQKGSELVGLSYRPLFAYFASKDLPNKENGWKVYAADFVELGEGTGIVHMAPGYGEEDMSLAKAKSIPVVIHVTPEGTFKSEVADFAGRPVKPKAAEKDGHQATDIEIIKFLARNGLLLHKEKIVHSYPHCHRCETPLYYTALPAWFLKIQELKPELAKQNENIHWVPGHLKRGRFLKSMEGAPDWNISRNRFWASPLPIWKCEACGGFEVVGSVSELKAKAGRKNRFHFIRHGESENVTKNILSCDNTVPSHLTEKGRSEVAESARAFAEVKFAAVYASPLLRTKETADEVAGLAGFDKEKIVYDDRLREIGFGAYNGRPSSEYHELFADGREKFTKAPEGGENLTEVKRRMAEFLYETDSKFENADVLVVSHEDPIWVAFAAAEGWSVDEALSRKSDGHFIRTGQAKAMEFAQLPHDRDFNFDLHRPYIDAVVLKCPCGGEKRRVPEVIDCWFESGSMPFAQRHYPMENRNWFHENFPADFVAEYIAQTRTWFYYMHVVSTMLFGTHPFRHVVTTGNVLAEDGQKMSKSKQNFPDPHKTFDRYGVDALRFYLLASPLMKSEDLNFSEKGVDEAYKKIILRLGNVLSFYELYKEDVPASADSAHVLDRWAVARLSETISEVTKAMDAYEIDRALSHADLFIDDLSTWYLRRSRERLKGEGEDKRAALSTFKLVLRELSKLLAPFTPFIAEHVFQKVREDRDADSVHLETWPEFPAPDRTLIDSMASARKTVSLALEARAGANIKVRQPLRLLKVKAPLESGFASLVAEEVNVKEVATDPGIAEEIELDTVVTPELKEEGNVREFVRFVQEMRKKAGLNPADAAVLKIKTVDAGREFIERNKDALRKAVNVKDIAFGAGEGEPINLDGAEFLVSIER